MASQQPSCGDNFGCWCGICFVGEQVARDGLPCFEVLRYKARGPQCFIRTKKQGRMKRATFPLCK